MRSFITDTAIAIVDQRSEIEPISVSPKKACVMLDVGLTRLYELIKARELESYKEGRSTKITVASIRARVARRVASAAAPAPEPRAA